MKGDVVPHDIPFCADYIDYMVRTRVKTRRVMPCTFSLLDCFGEDESKSTKGDAVHLLISDSLLISELCCFFHYLLLFDYFEVLDFLTLFAL